MKKLYIGLIMMLSVASFVVISGCGNATGGGSSGGGGTTYSGKLSDPYISGATLAVVSTDGTYISGMIATTDSTGGFSFPTAVPVGCTIEMMSLGEHLGRDYSGPLLKKTVGSDGLLNITPLTNWESRGISAQAISDILSSASLTIAASAVGRDPMAGLSGITTFDSSSVDSIKQIKAAIFAYCISMIASNEFGADYTEAELNSTFMATVEDAVAQAIDSGISDTILVSINNQIDDINTSIEAMALGSTAYNVRHATADQVSKSAFNIAHYIMRQMIESDYSWSGSASSWFVIQDWGQALGVRYYFMDNYNYGNVIPSYSFIPANIRGLTSGQVAINVIGIQDAFNNNVTSIEVNSSSSNPLGAVEGYYLNTTSPSITTIEVEHHI